MTQAKVIDEIKKTIQNYDGKWNEKKGVWDFSVTIAERKAFLSTKKLTYSVKLKVDDLSKIIHFSEMLIEAGSGFSSGGSLDDVGSGGFGFKTESYNTLKGNRQGTIQEQSLLFGKDYSFRFDFQEISSKIKNVAEANGYAFDYQILPVK